MMFLFFIFHCLKPFVNIRVFRGKIKIIEKQFAKICVIYRLLYKPQLKNRPLDKLKRHHKMTNH
jgi:hypothetical protein